MNWWVWKVVTHSRMNATLREIEEWWSIEDLLDAHLLMDTFGEVERIAALKARQET